jgi:hypothetical protein
MLLLLRSLSFSLAAESFLYFIITLSSSSGVGEERKNPNPTYLIPRLRLPAFLFAAE